MCGFILHTKSFPSAVLTKTKLYIGEYIYIYIYTYNGNKFQEESSDIQLLRDSRESVRVLGSIKNYT
jgi:hypothetical protein